LRFLAIVIFLLRVLVTASTVISITKIINNLKFQPFYRKYLDGTSYKQLFVPEHDIQA